MDLVHQLSVKVRSFEYEALANKRRIEQLERQLKESKEQYREFKRFKAFRTACDSHPTLKKSVAKYIHTCVQCDTPKNIKCGKVLPRTTVLKVRNKPTPENPYPRLWHQSYQTIHNGDFVCGECFDWTIKTYCLCCPTDARVCYVKTGSSRFLNGGDTYTLKDGRREGHFVCATCLPHCRACTHKDHKDHKGHRWFNNRSPWNFQVAQFNDLGECGECVQRQRAEEKHIACQVWGAKQAKEDGVLSPAHIICSYL